MQHPILYSFRRCPYAIRARMALYYSGINCELREVSLKCKPLQMLSISPKGTVPVLQLADGKVIDESIDIVDYVLTLSDPHNLLIMDNIQANISNELQQLLHQEFIPLLTRYKYFVRYPEHSQQEYLQQIEKRVFHQLEKLLVNRDYLIDTYPKKIDLIILPFIRQFHLVDQKRLAASRYQAIYHWLINFVNTYWFEGIVMQKHQPWNAEDKPIFYL